MADDDKSSNELAQDRTDWAEDRTVQANERTFAGWMRTGMAAIGIAIALQAVFGEMERTWIPKSVATAFLLLAMLIFYAAWKNACKLIQRLDAHAAEPVSASRFGTIASIMAAGALGTGIVLWLI
ncbi:YidH family protein [Ahrensia sp. R2A130]|uniref:YidH family protein n=1 Tax=Ahrensia sp. R2A130 TaxID=744979 RepID=UPI0001E0ACFD|nr:DUF202 domain-containing protein [Ahrensia sp. R2A130]EFL87760.1 conserved domain protein [Ahrensia sp. R2A130]